MGAFMSPFVVTFPIVTMEHRSFDSRSHYHRHLRWQHVTTQPPHQIFIILAELGNVGPELRDLSAEGSVGVVQHPGGVGGLRPPNKSRHHRNREVGRSFKLLNKRSLEVARCDCLDLLHFFYTSDHDLQGRLDLEFFHERLLHPVALSILLEPAGSHELFSSELPLLSP